MFRMALVGATGAVGRELLQLVSRLDLPDVEIIPVASARSVGTDLSGYAVPGMTLHPVTVLEDVDFSRIDVAFFMAGAELSRQVAEKVAGTGCLVIDNSSAFRQRDDIPLVVPQINPHTLRTRPPANIIANPNCSTIQLVRALHPLNAVSALSRVILTTYQAASGGGVRGLAELADSSRQILDGGEPAAHGRFGQPLAFNLVPQIGELDEDGEAHEERKLRREAGKIMSLPDLRISATAVRASVFHCHSEAVWVQFERPVPAAEAEQALAATAGIWLYRNGDNPPYPTPRIVERSGDGRAWVHVGRVRADAGDPNALWLWITADNLWVGAALNALEILEAVLDYGWLQR
jgi:aspartate-semialdehyde dehydrogenase